MSYTLTSATDWRDLLDKISTFVVADSWTEEYDNGSSTDKQIAFSKGNCHVAIGEQASQNPMTPEAGWSDARLYSALGTSIDTGNEYFYGHPGSPVTGVTDGDRVILNDLAAALSNVWLFSGPGTGPDYCHVVMQTAGDRYSHFSFGELDPLGMSTPDVGYLCSMYYEFWPAGPANNPLESYGHTYGHFFTANALANVLANTLPASGFPSAGVLVDTDFTPSFTIGDQDSDHYASLSGKFLDFFLPVSNQLVTGGTALHPIPVFCQSSDNITHCFLGILPGVRLVDISNHTPGSSLTFGSEEWVVFPFKRKGIADNLNIGGDPQDDANTLSYGLAYKKNT